MNYGKYQIRIIIFFLLVAGLGVAAYKVEYLGIPIQPGTTHFYWNIGAKITFQGNDSKVEVSMVLPEEQNGMRILNTKIPYNNYKFSIKKSEGEDKAIWRKPSVKKNQTLYYNIEVMPDKYFLIPKKQIKATTIKKGELENLKTKDQNILEALLLKIKTAPTKPLSYAAELINCFNNDQDFKSIKERLFKKEKLDFQSLLYKLLQYKGIKVKKVAAVKLEDGLHNAPLTLLLQIYDGKKTYLFSLMHGRIEHPNKYFIWREGGNSTLEVIGGVNSKILISVSKHPISIRAIAKNKKVAKDIALHNFSLYSLPASEQNAFKYILMVPIGALVVVLLRILIGLRTSGTFMPILIALAFMQTTLITGILMFVIIIGIGLVIRSYFSHLNLLLVARISAVVIIVIIIMAICSIVSYKFGFTEALKITFFPMIILAWTIERMSIIWEEDGPKEAIIQGSNSLLVAIIAFFAMSNFWIKYLVFNFPELLLVILAFIIIAGRYSGYRLSELVRFKTMEK